MKEPWGEVLKIRYVKLHFTLLFPEDCTLPKNKASALRGGIGEMLLRSNCIRDRDCENCDFQRECIVQRTMYSQLDRKPDFMTTGDSVGYVIECENHEETFVAGNTLTFSLLLFGKNIVYFQQYLHALFTLGEHGLGKNYARFIIVNIRNSTGEDILNRGNIYMKQYKIETLENYVENRKKQLQKRTSRHHIHFHTPLTQKYQGKFLQKFQMDAIVKSIQRRLYILNCFEEQDVEWFYQKQFQAPKILWQKSCPVKIRRYSGRQESGMYLKGIQGKIQLEEIPQELWELLLAGELVHIGKNTSFGFGRYTIK